MNKKTLINTVIMPYPIPLSNNGMGVAIPQTGKFEVEFIKDSTPLYIAPQHGHISIFSLEPMVDRKAAKKESRSFYLAPSGVMMTDLDTSRFKYSMSLQHNGAIFHLFEEAK